MTKDKALKLALEVLNRCGSDSYVMEQEAITAIKEALAQPEQSTPCGEPVAMRYDFDGYGWKYIDNGSGSNWQTRIENAEPVYTAPPKHEWVGLTDEEIDEVHGSPMSDEHSGLLGFVRAVLAKSKEKNT